MNSIAEFAKIIAPYTGIVEIFSTIAGLGLGVFVYIGKYTSKGAVKSILSLIIITSPVFFLIIFMMMADGMLKLKGILVLLTYPITILGFVSLAPFLFLKDFPALGFAAAGYVLGGLLGILAAALRTEL